MRKEVEVAKDESAKWFSLVISFPSNKKAFQWSEIRKFWKNYKKDMNNDNEKNANEIFTEGPEILLQQKIGLL